MNHMLSGIFFNKFLIIIWSI